MRLGSNPLKHATIAPPARVVVLVITHLPKMESDYHRERLSVILRSLSSLMDNIDMATKEYSLMIWDNDSCQKATDHFVRLLPDQIILSRNIGKTNALKSVMRMLPPDTILAYGDDDIEYFPNWLAPQIQILETFPNVGTVTGWPVRITATWGTEETKKWAGNNNALNKHLRHNHANPHLLIDAIVEQGRFIPDEWERDYCESVGRDYQSYSAVTWGAPDTRITYKGVSAYAMSQHAQFVCYPERIEPLIEWTDRAMSDEIPFDKAVDAAGLLRLATVERYCRHIGNVLEKG